MRVKGMHTRSLPALAAGLAAVAVNGLLCASAYAQTRSPSPPPVAPSPPTYEGVWYDDTGQGAVEIAPCGDRLCGRIVWLRSPTDAAGRPLVDDLNPDPARRGQPICGLYVIGELKRQRDGSWDQGWIYDPKVGKAYDVELRLRAADTLQVTGYLGVKFLSETLIWKRAPDNLRRCDIQARL
ncbi:MAG TPA: DUF2147 domain-containing protein [Hyphomicrobiaceae bacterium]|nr:DUF2147 domain-containing protein [Hyphomicrobiaceae bacterium]